MCNRQHHDHIVLTAWGSLLNARPWPDADLEIAECPECRSTLARSITPTLTDIEHREREIAEREPSRSHSRIDSCAAPTPTRAFRKD